MGNIILGIVAAIAITVLLVFPTIAGIATWKVLLAVVGFAIVVASGRGKPR